MLSNLKNKMNNSTVIPFIIIFTLLSIGILTPILSIVIFAAFLAYYIRPIAFKIRPYVKYDTLAVLLGMLILATPIVVLLYFTFAEFLSIVISIFGSLNLAAGDTALNNTANGTMHNMGMSDNMSSNIISYLQSAVQQFISYVARFIIGLLASLPGVAAQILILIFATFYFARDGDKIVEYIKDIIPDNDHDFYQQIFNSAEDTLKSIIIGNVIPAIILGILSGIIYYLLGYPYVILLAIVSGIAMFIPIIGPWIVYGAIGIISILMGNTTQGVLVIIFGWIIETSTDFYIRPRISVEYSEVHPLVFLLGFIYGAVMLGIPGLFIGPLILGITYSSYKVYRKQKKAKKISIG
jgi:predicted PurR-regulated permease PerM